MIWLTFFVTAWLAWAAPVAPTPRLRVNLGCGLGGSNLTLTPYSAANGVCNSGYVDLITKPRTNTLDWPQLQTGLVGPEFGFFGGHASVYNSDGFHTDMPFASFQFAVELWMMFSVQQTTPKHIFGFRRGFSSTTLSIATANTGLHIRFSRFGGEVSALIPVPTTFHASANVMYHVLVSFMGGGSGSNFTVSAAFTPENQVAYPVVYSKEIMPGVDNFYFSDLNVLYVGGEFAITPGFNAQKYNATLFALNFYAQPMGYYDFRTLHALGSPRVNLTCTAVNFTTPYEEPVLIAGLGCINHYAPLRTQPFLAIVPPAHGSLVEGFEGLEYVPDPGFSGVDHFMYGVNTKVFVIVGPMDVPFELVAITASLPAAGPVLFEFIGSATTPGESLASIVAVGGQITLTAPFWAYENVTLGECGSLLGSGRCSEIGMRAGVHDFQRLLDTLRFTASGGDSTLNVTFGDVWAELNGTFTASPPRVSSADVTGIVIVCGVGAGILGVLILVAIFMSC